MVITSAMCTQSKPFEYIWKHRHYDGRTTSDTQTWKYMPTVGNIDTSDVIMIIYIHLHEPYWIQLSTEKGWYMYWTVPMLLLNVHTHQHNSMSWLGDRTSALVAARPYFWSPRPPLCRMALHKRFCRLTCVCQGKSYHMSLRILWYLIIRR